MKALVHQSEARVVGTAPAFTPKRIGDLTERDTKGVYRVETGTQLGPIPRSPYVILAVTVTADLLDLYQYRATGETITDGQTASRHDPALDKPLQTAKADARQTVEAARAAASAYGYAQGNWFRADGQALNGMSLRIDAQAGDPLPADYTWPAADGSRVPMDLASLIALRRDLTNHVQAQYDHAELTLNPQIDAVASVPELRTLDLTGGFAEAYQPQEV